MLLNKVRKNIIDLLRDILSENYRDRLRYNVELTQHVCKRIRLLIRIVFSQNTISGLKLRARKELFDLDGNLLPIFAFRKYSFRKNEVTHRYILKPLTKRVPPIYGRPRIWNKKHFKVRALEKASVYNLMEVWCSDKGRIFTQDGQAAFEAWNRCDIKLFHKLRNYCRGVDLTDHRANKDSIPVIDKAVIATQSNDCAYGHFLMEVIPRLGLVGMSQLQNIPVYVSTKYPQYLEALHYLGLRENILSSQKYPVIYCKEAIIPKFQSTGYFQYPQFAIETLSMIKARVLAESKDFRDNPRRIFLSKMGYESVVGEESVVPLLLQRGFEIIVPQELSFADQVRLFHNAETVVSQNNSEICNILFCQPGSKIISLFHASNTQALMSITETLGHDYFVVKTNTGSLIRWQRKCCFEPDITALSAALDAAGVKC